MKNTGDITIEAHGQGNPQESTKCHLRADSYFNTDETNWSPFKWGHLICWNREQRVNLIKSKGIHFPQNLAIQPDVIIIYDNNLLTQNLTT